MTRCVCDDEFAFCGGKVAVGNVDRDALLAFGTQTVGEEREVEHAGCRCPFALDGPELIVVDTLRVIEQASDKGGFAVVHGACSRQAEEVFGGLTPEIRGYIKGRGDLERLCFGSMTEQGIEVCDALIPDLGLARGSTIRGHQGTVEGLCH